MRRWTRTARLERRVARIERVLEVARARLAADRAALDAEACALGLHDWGDWTAVADPVDVAGEGVLVHCVRQCRAAECQATETRSFPF